MGGGSATGREPAGADGLARTVHDLHGPLTVIRGMCASLLREERSPDRRRALGLIDAEVVRVAAGLHGLTSGGRPATGAGTCDVAALVAEAVQRFAPLADTGGRRILTRGRRAPTPVVADAAALRRALDNLVLNALRHGGDGGTVLIGLSVRRGWAEVRVRDDGPGIPSADRETIFLAGRRGSAPRGAGRGLGLAIAREIVASSGGTLTLDAVGEGACFRIALPIHRCPDAGPRAA